MTMATTYYAATARDRLADAQSVLDAHTSDPAGRCVACDAIDPCDERERAGAVFARSGALPRRTPGLTRPELVSPRRVGGAGGTWFRA